MIKFIKNLYWRLYDWQLAKWPRTMSLKDFEAWSARKHKRNGFRPIVSRKTFDELFK